MELQWILKGIARLVIDFHRQKKYNHFTLPYPALAINELPGAHGQLSRFAA
jgi:hypothetical protein